MEDRQRSYQIRIDLRSVGLLLCGLAWLLLASALLDVSFYHQRYPWFTQTPLFAFLFRPLLSGLHIDRVWWAEHWTAVCGGIFFLEQCALGLFLHRLSKRFRWFSAARRRLLFFGVSILLGLYAGYQQFQFLFIEADFQIWYALQPLVQSLLASAFLLAAAALLSKLSRRFSPKARE